MIDSADMEACAASIKHGSRSFHAASKVLPRRVREPAFALYAFCRLADDAVDLSDAKRAAVLDLHDRLDSAYGGRPRDAAPDRAFAAIAKAYDIPRTVPDALLEGFAWDAMERSYETLSEVYDYSARVASTVGVMMCLLMGVRDRDALARAADLGVAMQLTNIARDVGEDAREGRLYLPVAWLAEAGVSREAFTADPEAHAELAHRCALRLLSAADGLYFKAMAGVGKLPRDCRTGITAARFIYAEIGREVRRIGPDFVNVRAHSSKARKLALLTKSATQVALMSVMPQSAVLHAAPLDETQFLVDAAAEPQQARGEWGGPILELMAHLKAQDMAQLNVQGRG